MSVVTNPLKYLFIAKFKDGTHYTQNSTDTAVYPGVKGTAFSDIVTRLNEISLFFLVEPGTEKVVAGVNLETGEFVVGGQVFEAAEQNFMKVNPLKLIFFREVKKRMTVSGTVMDDLSVEQEVDSNASMFVSRYLIGWETTDRFKKKVQQIIAIN